MACRSGARMRLLLTLLPILALALPAAAQESTASYQVRGPGGAVAWGLGDQPGTDVVVFAFSDLARVGEDAAAGPRVTFSVTHWSAVGTAFVRRQWYGDVPIEPRMLTIGPGLTEATLDAEVTGSLETRDSGGSVLRREASGRIQVRWAPSGNLANSTANFIHQTPAYIVTLQAVGGGRMATTIATVTVEALGVGPINLVGLGALLAPTTGILVVRMP